MTRYARQRGTRPAYITCRPTSCSARGVVQPSACGDVPLASSGRGEASLEYETVPNETSPYSSSSPIPAPLRMSSSKRRSAGPMRGPGPFVLISSSPSMIS